jgi:hypothetical protein
MPFFQANAQNAGVVRQAGFLENWGRVIITVIGAGNVFIATTKEALEMPGAGGQQQGAQFSQANTSPPKDIPWVGEIWFLIVGNGTSVDFQIPDKRGIPPNIQRGDRNLPNRY